MIKAEVMKQAMERKIAFIKTMITRSNRAHMNQLIKDINMEKSRITGDISKEQLDAICSRLDTSFSFEIDEVTKIEQAKKRNKGLPKLSGKDHEIELAEIVRARAMDGIKTIIEMIVDRKPFGYKAMIKFALYISNKDTQYWIENRNESFDRIWFSRAFQKATAEELAY